MKKVLFPLLLALLAVVFAACGTSSSNTGTIATSTPGATATQATHFKVGDTVTVGNVWKVVVNSITTDNGGSYSSLKSGDIYAVIDISMTNVSSSEQTVSSLLMFTFKDSTGQKYNESFDPNVNGASPNGKVATGDTLRGLLVYEVPEAQKHFTLAFAPNITASGQTIWDLSLP